MDNKFLKKVLDSGLDVRYNICGDRRGNELHILLRLSLNSNNKLYRAQLPDMYILSYSQYNFKEKNRAPSYQLGAVIFYDIFSTTTVLFPSSRAFSIAVLKLKPSSRPTEL